jgi:periplasmic protein TonB
MGRRIPMVPRRRAALARNRLEIAAAVSAAIHIMLIAALIITFPNRKPQEAAPSTSVQVVFEPGAKTASAPAARKGINQKAAEAAPRGPSAPAPARMAQAAPPLPLPPAPARPPPTPPPPKPLPPKPLPPKPVPVRKPVPSPPPPPPPLPKINLPPPPPPAPPVPKPPVPVPAPRPAPPIPKPAPVNDANAEMNLALPPLPELAPVPLPAPPPPLPPAPERFARQPSRTRSSALGGAMVMNGMSFSGGGSPSGGFTRGMNLAPPEAQQPGSQSDLTVQGDVGANWMAELEQWVNQRKYYPEIAGEMGQQGTSVIRFQVNRAGQVSHLELLTPTGYALLDQAWLGIFRGADLPPRPHDGTSDIATITASMHFEIIQ